MSQDNSTVEYRDIQGFPGYRIGNDGSVLSCWNFRNGMRSTWKLRKSSFADGYEQVQMRVGGKAVTRKVARLVLKAFVGPCPQGMQCCHNDGNRANNHVTNLRWDTVESNMRDRDRHGKTAKGERSGSARLSESQVLSIREQASHGTRLCVLARDFGVSEPHVSRIVSGEKWKHLSGHRSGATASTRQL